MMENKLYYNTILCISVLLPYTVSVGSETGEYKLDTQFEVAPSIIYGTSIVVGGLINMKGYKLFKPTAFISAFFLSGYFIYFALADFFKHYTHVQIIAAIGALIGAILLACLVIYFINFGIFLIGVAGGVAVGQFVFAAFLTKLSPEHTDIIMYATIILLGLSGGILTLTFKRTLIIIFSSLLGAIVTIRSIGYFAGEYPAPEELIDTAKAYQDGKEVDIPIIWWTYFGATVFLSLLGMFVQFKYTGKDLEKNKKLKQEQEKSNIAPSVNVETRSKPIG